MLCAGVSNNSIILKEERKKRKTFTRWKTCLELHVSGDCNRILSSVLELASNQGHALGQEKLLIHNNPEQVR